jgi:hypothetical protein
MTSRTIPAASDIPTSGGDVADAGFVPCHFGPDLVLDEKPSPAPAAISHDEPFKAYPKPPHKPPLTLKTLPINSIEQSRRRMARAQSADRLRRR